MAVVTQSHQTGSWLRPTVPDTVGFVRVRASSGDNAGAGTVAPATAPATPTAGNLLIAIVGFRGGTGTTITMSGWTLAKRQDSTTNVGVAIYYKIAAGNETLASWTATLSPTTTKATIHVAEYGGSMNPPVLDAAAGGTIGTTSPANTGTTGTTTNATDLIIGAISTLNSITLTAPTNNFVQVGITEASTGGAATTRNSSAHLERITTATGTFSSAMTEGSAQTWAGAIQAFKPSNTLTRQCATHSFLYRSPTPTTTTNALKLATATTSHGTNATVVKTTTIAHGTNATLVTPSSIVSTSTDAYTFRPATQTTASFITTDRTTFGQWWPTYGNDGYSLAPNGTESLPAYVDSVTPTNANNFTWAYPDTTAAGAYYVAYGNTTRTSSTWYASTSFDIDVVVNDGAQHQIALYLYDGGGGLRNTQVEVINPATGAVIDTRTTGAHDNGVYLIWTAVGSLRFRMTRLLGANTCAVGPLFDPPSVPIVANQAQHSTSGYLQTFGSHSTDTLASPPGARVHRTTGYVLPPLATFVLDDSDASFTKVGAWNSFGFGYNGDLVYAGDNTPTPYAIWTSPPIQGGTYKLHSNWNSGVNHTPAAPLTISRNGVVVGTYYVNQQAISTGGDYGFQQFGQIEAQNGDVISIRIDHVTGQGDTVADAIKFELVPAYTKSNSTDALLAGVTLTTSTISGTANALLRAVSSRQVAADAFKYATKTLNQGSNGLLRAAINIYHATNSVLSSATGKFQLADALLRATRSISGMTNTALPATTVKAHSTGALLRASSVSTHSTDALLPSTTTKTASTNALARATAIRAHATDALLRRTAATATTADALVRSFTATIHGTGSLLRATTTRSHGVNTTLPATSTKVHTTDCRLWAQATRQCSTDSRTYTANGVGHGTNSLKFGGSVRSQRVDTVKYVQGTAQYSTSSLLRATRTPSYAASGYAKAAGGLVHTTGGNQFAASARSHTTGAVLPTPTTRQHATDTRLAAADIASRVCSTNADLKGPGFAGHDADAVKWWSATRFNRTSAFAYGAFTKPHTTGALLRNRVTIDTSTNALCKLGSTRQHTATAFKATAAAGLRSYATDADLAGTASRQHTIGAIAYLATALTHGGQSLLATVAATASTHATDADLAGASTASYQTTGLRQAVLARTYGTAGYASKAVTVSHGADTFLRATFAANHQSNGSLRKAAVISHATEAVVQGRDVKFSLVDAVLKAVDTTARFSTDAIRRTFAMRFHRTLAMLQTVRVAGHATGSQLRCVRTIAFGTDAFLPTMTSLQSTTSSAIRATAKVTHGSGAVISLPAARVVRTDGVLRGRFVAWHSADSLIALAIARATTFATNANLSRVAIASHQANSLRFGVVSRPHSTGGLLRASGMVSAATDALARRSRLANHVTRALLQAVRTRVHGTHGLARIAESVAHRVDALPKIVVVTAHTTAGHKRGAVVTTFGTNTKLFRAGVPIHATDAFARRARIAIHATSAIKLGTRQKSQSVAASIYAAGSTAHAIDAYIALSIGKAHSIDATLLAILAAYHRTHATLHTIRLGGIFGESVFVEPIVTIWE